MQPHAPSSYARWAADVRGEGRAVRVAAHVDAGFLVISTWKADVCVGTVRLVPHEASELMTGIAHGLAERASGYVVPVLPAAPAKRRHDTEALPTQRPVPDDLPG
ncbi:hypothetical protein BH18ACT7_BH18ACT7_05010 [soil metagenome]